MTRPSLPVVRTESQQQAAIWGIALGTLAVIIALIWASGGFGTGAAPYVGRQVQMGETVETRFWDIVVEGAGYELTEFDDELIVELVVTNKQPRAALDITQDILVAGGPGLGAMAADYCDPLAGGDFQPLVSTRASCTFVFDDDGVRAPAPGTEFAFELVITEQVLSRGFLGGTEPVAGEPAAWLALTAQQQGEDQ